MAAELTLLEHGQSLRRRRSVERCLTLARKIGFAAVLVVVLIVGLSVIKVERVQHLFGRTTGSPGASSKKEGAVVQEAVRLYELGRFHYNRLTDEDLKKCIEYMNQAIQIDPEFTPAYVTLFEVAVWATADMPLDRE